jgi:hypothetical protein
VRGVSWMAGIRCVEDARAMAGTRERIPAVVGARKESRTSEESGEGRRLGRMPLASARALIGAFAVAGENTDKRSLSVPPNAVNHFEVG